MQNLIRDIRQMIISSKVVAFKAEDNRDDVTVNEASLGYSTGNVDEHLDTEENVFVNNNKTTSHRHFAVNHYPKSVLPSEILKLN